MVEVSVTVVLEERVLVTCGSWDVIVVCTVMVDVYVSNCWGRVVYDVAVLVIVEVYFWASGVTVVPGVVVMVNGLVNVMLRMRLVVFTAPLGETDV
jgi:hypothetical protein